MILKNINVFVILVLCSESLCEEEIVVEIGDGKIKGLVKTTATNNDFYSFQGIPYAQPPVNELRFQAPKPVEPWDDIVDATYAKNICYQVGEDTKEENEDCLFLNVYTPKNPLARPSNPLLPVMVFIHGGGFVGGSSNSYGPHHFMEQEVVLVTLNYRLGPFGFFSTGNDAIPGNAGLKDQNLALVWVNKNIRFFGGDAEQVTLFGESAGAASVAYHILSDKSNGLFRAAILESGTALSPWAYQRHQVEITYQTAEYIEPNLNHNNVTSTELLEFLTSLPAKAIDQASYTMRGTESDDYMQIQQGFFYAPVIEHEHEGAYITQNMYEILNNGTFYKLPIIIGFNSEESVFMADNPNGFKSTAQHFDQHHNLLVPFDLRIQDEETEAEAAEKIKFLYTEGNFADDPSTLVSYFSDQSFIRSIIKHAELQSRYTNVYFYRFAYTGVLGGHTDKSVEGFSGAVRHGEEVGYLFTNDNTIDLSDFPKSDALVARMFITLFTNFAKTLNPTPENNDLVNNVLWPKVNPIYFPYLDIGSYLRVRLHPRNNTFSEWEDIYEKFGEGPFDTY